MTNLGIITTIFLTSAITAGGTYYVTTQVEPVSGQEETVTMAQPQTTSPPQLTQPTQAPQKPDLPQQGTKPLNIVVHTHVTHHEPKKPRTKSYSERVADTRKAIYGQQPKFDMNFQ